MLLTYIVHGVDVKHAFLRLRMLCAVTDVQIFVFRTTVIIKDQVEREASVPNPDFEKRVDLPVDFEVARHSVTQLPVHVVVRTHDVVQLGPDFFALKGSPRQLLRRIKAFCLLLLLHVLKVCDLIYVRQSFGNVLVDAPSERLFLKYPLRIALCVTSAVELELTNVRGLRRAESS